MQAGWATFEQVRFDHASHPISRLLRREPRICAFDIHRRRKRVQHADMHMCVAHIRFDKSYYQMTK